MHSSSFVFLWCALLRFTLSATLQCIELLTRVTTLYSTSPPLVYHSGFVRHPLWEVSSNEPAPLMRAKVSWSKCNSSRQPSLMCGVALGFPSCPLLARWAPPFASSHEVWRLSSFVCWCDWHLSPPPHCKSIQAKAGPRSLSATAVYSSTV